MPKQKIKDRCGSLCPVRGSEVSSMALEAGSIMSRCRNILREAEGTGLSLVGHGNSVVLLITRPENSRVVPPAEGPTPVQKFAVLFPDRGQGWESTGRACRMLDTSVQECTASTVSQD